MRIKKVIAWVLILSFSLALMPGCGKKGPEVTNPFTVDYEITEENIGFFTDGDTLETIASATPFYSGAYPLPGQKLEEYENLRQAKIEEIIKEAETLIKAVEDAEDEVGDVRKELLAFLDEAGKKEAKLEGFNRETLVTLGSLSSGRAIALAQYRSLEVDENSLPYSRAWVQYFKVYKAMESAGYILKEADEILGRGAIAYAFLSGHPDYQVKDAALKFDRAMEGYDGKLKDLQKVQESLIKVDCGLRQLITADNYLAIAAVAYMKSEMPAVKKAAAEIRANEVISEKQIEDLKTYIDFYEKWIAECEKSVNSIDKRFLIQIAEREETGYAWATEEVATNYKNAFDVLNIDIEKAAASQKKAAEEQEGYFSKGWKLVKGAAQEAKNVVGGAVDLMGTGLRNMTAAGYGMYYGMSYTDIVEMCRENNQELIDNFKKGIAGSQTFKTARDYIEGIEQGVGEIAGSGVEKVIGKGVTSWTANFVAKTTVGFFTDLAKGVYKIADTGASAGEMAEGVLDITLAMVGGSKSVVRASQVGGLLAEEGKLAARAAGSFIGEAQFNQQVKKLMQEKADILAKKSLSWGDWQALSTNEMLMDINKNLIQDMQKCRETLLKEMVNLLPGKKEAVESIKKAGKESLEEMFRKTFENSLSGYKEALQSVVGSSGKEYIDNLFANVVDGYVKEMAGEIVDSFFAPSLEELNGKWQVTTTIEGIEANTGDAFADKAIREQYEKLSKSSQGWVDVTCSADGTLTVHVSGANLNVPPSYLTYNYKYEDGNIICSRDYRFNDSSGGTERYVFEGKLAVEGEQMVIRGNYVQTFYHPSYKNGGYIRTRGTEVWRKNIEQNN